MVTRNIAIAYKKLKHVPHDKMETDLYKLPTISVYKVVEMSELSDGYITSCCGGSINYIEVQEDYSVLKTIATRIMQKYDLPENVTKCPMTNITILVDKETQEKYKGRLNWTYELPHLTKGTEAVARFIQPPYRSRPGSLMAKARKNL